MPYFPTAPWPLTHFLVQILGSAYLLGSNPEQLGILYDEEAKTLEPWKDSPNEISRHDWRDFLGDGR